MIPLPSLRRRLAIPSLSDGIWLEDVLTPPVQHVSSSAKFALISESSQCAFPALFVLSVAVDEENSHIVVKMMKQPTSTVAAIKRRHLVNASPLRHA